MRPLYTKSFSRDFTLANMEIWCRGEALNDKIWTAARQPFRPYIVFEKTDATVDCYYDKRGIDWMKARLLEEMRKDDNFVAVLERRLMEYTSRLRALRSKGYVLTHDTLCEYLDIFEQGYVWFEAAWWVWDLSEEELQGVVLPDKFRELRVSTEDYAPASETVIRKSLPKLYPHLSDFIEVMRVDEIKNNSFPDVKMLEERTKGYFLVNGEVFTGVSPQYVEDKYDIRLETVIAKDVTRLTGASAYKGKAFGKVKIVLNTKMLDKVENGDVLVSHMTLPDFLPAIKKAAAIITDEGGVMCHAAIVAREMEKPCIIGTKIATKVLKDGDMVEVDANRGIVKILTKAR